jgi:hypothetical protein
MESSPYIQLLKNTLSYQLWPEPLHRIRLEEEQLAKIRGQIAGIDRFRGEDTSRFQVGIDLKVSARDKETGTLLAGIC